MSTAKYTRQYLGVTVTAQNYRDILKKEGRYGINFHTKHLRAYLKGRLEFIHGVLKDEFGKTLGPARHKVKQKIYLVNPT